MVRRWVFIDPYLASGAPDASYTVPINPREMSSVFAPKRVTPRTSSAITGMVLVTEGATLPVDWTFKGAILDKAHLDALTRWYQKRHRIRIIDHYGRMLSVYLTAFDPVPKRGNNKPWRHEYEMKALVFSVGPASP